MVKGINSNIRGVKLKKNKWNMRFVHSGSTSLCRQSRDNIIVFHAKSISFAKRQSLLNNITQSNRIGPCLYAGRLKING